MSWIKDFYANAACNLISIESKGGGKRSGARIITHFAVVASTLYLLAIYDKSEVKNLSDKELKELLDDIPE